MEKRVSRLTFFRRELEQRVGFHYLAVGQWSVVAQMRDGKGTASLYVKEVHVSHAEGADQAKALVALEQNVRELWTIIEGITRP